MRRLQITLEDDDWDYPLSIHTEYVDRQPRQYLVDVRRDEITLTPIATEIGLGEK